MSSTNYAGSDENEPIVAETVLDDDEDDVSLDSLPEYGVSTLQGLDLFDLGALDADSGPSSSSPDPVILGSDISAEEDLVGLYFDILDDESITSSSSLSSQDKDSLRAHVQAIGVAHLDAPSSTPTDVPRNMKALYGMQNILAENPGSRTNAIYRTIHSLTKGSDLCAHMDGGAQVSTTNKQNLLWHQSELRSCKLRLVDAGG